MCVTKCACEVLTYDEGSEEAAGGAASHDHAREGEEPIGGREGGPEAADHLDGGVQHERLLAANPAEQSVMGVIRFAAHWVCNADTVKYLSYANCGVPWKHVRTLVHV